MMMNNEEKILAVLESMQGTIESMQKDISELKQGQQELGVKTDRIERELDKVRLSVGEIRIRADLNETAVFKLQRSVTAIEATTERLHESVAVILEHSNKFNDIKKVV